MKLNQIKFQIVKFIKKNSKYILVSCIVLIVAYIIYNFVFIKEGMNETPIYNNKDTGACTIVFGDHNPENRFKRFKSTLEDDDFKKLLKKNRI